MANAGSLTFALTADDAAMQAALSRVHHSIEGLADKAKHTAIFLGELFAVREVVHFAKEFVAAAAEQELSSKKLETALGRRSEALRDQADALAHVTAFSDNEITSAQAMIAAYVKDENQIKAATRATMDFAAAKGIGLVEAAGLVGRTIGTETEALSRYGVKTTGAIGSTERLTSTLDDLSAHFGGQARAQADTYTGRMAILHNQMEKLKEQIGEKLIPVFEHLSGRFFRTAEAATNATAKMLDWVAMNADMVIGIGKLVLGLGAVVKIAPMVQAAFNSITATPLGRALSLLALAALGVKEGFDFWVKGGIGPVSDALAHGMVAAGLYGGEISKLNSLMREAQEIHEGLVRAQNDFAEAKGPDAQVKAMESLIKLTRQQIELEEKRAKATARTPHIAGISALISPGEYARMIFPSNTAGLDEQNRKNAEAYIESLKRKNEEQEKEKKKLEEIAEAQKSLNWITKTFIDPFRGAKATEGHKATLSFFEAAKKAAMEFYEGLKKIAEAQQAVRDKLLILGTSGLDRQLKELELERKSLKDEATKAFGSGAPLDAAIAEINQKIDKAKGGAFGKAMGESLDKLGEMVKERGDFEFKINLLGVDEATRRIMELDQKQKELLEEAARLKEDTPENIAKIKAGIEREKAGMAPKPSFVSIGEAFNKFQSSIFANDTGKQQVEEARKANEKADKIAENTAKTATGIEKLQTAGVFGVA